MRSLLLCFTARTKSLPGLQPSASATDWADLLSKPALHCRFFFILYFFGSADTGIKNSARLDLIIQFSPEICVGTGTIAFFLLSKRPATFGGSRNFGRRRRSRGNCRHFIFSRSAVVAAGAWHHFLDPRFIFTAEVTSRSRARQGTAGAMIRKTGEPFMFFKGK